MRTGQTGISHTCTEAVEKFKTVRAPVPGLHTLQLPYLVKISSPDMSRKYQMIMMIFIFNHGLAGKNSRKALADLPGFHRGGREALHQLALEVEGAPWVAHCWGPENWCPWIICIHIIWSIMVHYPSHMSNRWCIYIYIMAYDILGIWIIILEYYIMWVKQCHKPPMTGNGNVTIAHINKWWWLGDGANGIVLPPLYI